MRRGGEMNTICSSFPGELSTRAGACWANPAARQGHRTPEGRARDRAPERISMKPALSPRPGRRGAQPRPRRGASRMPGASGRRDAMGTSSSRVKAGPLATPTATEGEAGAAPVITWSSGTSE